MNSMYPFGAHRDLYHPPRVTSGSFLQREDVHLVLRQQPKEALITTEGKEKARKPIDPPPIIQLCVQTHVDPPQHYLQSPYLFMCVSLHRVDKDEAWTSHAASKSLAGSLTSSLHRLKDIDNKDGGFFVFGDISVKIQGEFRLHFSLFDLRKDLSEVQYLGAVTSEPFKVVLPKDFKGMDESTYLSRAFSDQGVRLRLRKEPRAMMGNKRPYPYSAEATSAPLRPNLPATPTLKRFHADTDDHHDLALPASYPPIKRFRADTEDHQDLALPSSFSMNKRFRTENEDHQDLSLPGSLSGSLSSSLPASLPTSYLPQYSIPQQRLPQLPQQNLYQLPMFSSASTGASSPFHFGYQGNDWRHGQ